MKKKKTFQKPLKAVVLTFCLIIGFFLGLAYSTPPENAYIRGDRM